MKTQSQVNTIPLSFPRDIVDCFFTDAGRPRVDEYRQITLKVRVCTIPHICEIEIHLETLFHLHTEEAIHGYRRYTDVMSLKTHRRAPFMDCRPPQSFEGMLRVIPIHEEDCQINKADCIVYACSTIFLYCPFCPRTWPCTTTRQLPKYYRRLHPIS